MRSTRVDIHLDNLITNFNIIKEKCNNVSICAPVKANAYGHGAVEVSKVLQDAGCDFFGVATIYEAEELIDSGINRPIILFSLPVPSDIKFIVQLNIEPIVTTIEFITLLEKECFLQNKNINVHLKIDTGMGRIGCTPEKALDLGKTIENSKVLNLNGLCTHLSTSEIEDQSYTKFQLNKFRNVLKEFKTNNIKPKYIHAANSGAVLKDSTSLFNMVRTGISLYGYPPTLDIEDNIDYKPVLELQTKIVELKKVPKDTSVSYGRTFITTKESYIATLPIGYADGYFRALSNKGHVYINGKLYPIIGNICMDQMMVEVDEWVKLYDEVVLIGTEPDQPNAKTLADTIGTISYEILTNIHRVKRFYIKY